MKRKLIFFLLVVLTCVSMLAFSACSSSPEKPDGLKTISGITFTDVTTTYDGTEKRIEISGTLPDGVTVEYTNNVGTNANEYVATATLSGEGYKEKTLTAKLTINKATFDMSNASWNYTSAFTYNGSEKTVSVVGLPSGVTVASYSENAKTNAGSYTATVSFNYDATNYNTPVLADCSWVINKATYDMSNARWDYTSAFTYNGSEKTVSVVGLPSGVTIASYSENTKTNAGSYTATVSFNYDATNYNTPVLADCSWVINKATLLGISLDGSILVEYDTLEHSLQILGDVPADVTVVITYNGKELSGVTEVGSYEVIATLTSPNYETLILTKTLIISATEEQLYSVNVNGTIYFQNNLDDNKLYSYKTQLNKASNDVPKFMMANGSTVYYVSENLISPSIKSFSLTAALPSKIINARAESLATDGTYIYYSVNSLLVSAENKGIWKIKLDGSEETPTRLTEDKAEYLTYYNNYLYYANASESNNLYKISTNANNAKGTCLWEEKVSYIIENNGILYFNSNAGLTNGSAIRKYIISSNTCIKLTTDAGKYLTFADNKIYYVNNDLLTGTLFGDGIYCVSATRTEDSSLPGMKVLEAENGNGYSSLTSDGTNLYYYKLHDKHFYSYDIAEETETDLMASFVVVDTTTLSTNPYAKITEHNGELYYINARDNNYLYKYNPTTKACYKVLDDQVSGVYFHNGYMYYSTYVLTNFALWRTNLETKETTKISSDRYDHLIFDGDYIYCIKVGSAYNNYIYKMNLDGTNATKIFDKSLWVADMYKEGNYLYFATNAGLLGKDDYIYKLDLTDNTYTKYDFESEAFTVANGIIYYYDHNDNTINSYNGTTVTTLVSNVVANDLKVINGKLYYSSTSKTVGFFSYDLSSKATTKISDNNAHGIIEYNGNIYFLQIGVGYTSDYPNGLGASNNDGCLYRYNGTTVTKLTK